MYIVLSQDATLCDNGGGTKLNQQLPMHEVVSLHVHYLENAEWEGHTTYAALWHRYLQNTERQAISRVEVTEALEQWKHWQPAEPLSATEKHLRLGPSSVVDIYNRAIIGGIHFRQQRMDCNAALKEKHSIDSYFLAMTTHGDDDEHWVFETGRAELFFMHTAPTAPHSPTITTPFIKAVWPEVPKPNRTTRTNLPIILPNVLKTDASYPLLQYITSVWPCTLVVPTTICVGSLDNLHDVPTNITANGATATSLRYYRLRNMNNTPSVVYNSAASKVEWDKLAQLTAEHETKRQEWATNG